MTATRLGELCALLAPLAWSFAVVLFRRSDAASPLSLNLFKNVFALGLLSLTLVLLGIPIPTDRPLGDWLRLGVSGLLGLAVADTLLFAGLRRIGAARLAVVDTVYAPVIVLQSWFLLGEPIHEAMLVGGLGVLGGVALATIDPRALAAAPGPDRRELVIGTVYALLAIVGTATGVVIARPVLQHADLVEVTWVRMAAGTIGMLVWTLVRGRSAEALVAFRPSRLWRTLVPGAFIGTYLSMLLWLGGFKWVDASVAAVLNQMATIYMLVLARLVLGETLRPRQVSGGLVAAAGALWIVLHR